MEEKKPKTAEQHAQDKDADNLMNYLIAKTYSRHSKLTEDEFLKEIGFEGSGMTEAEAVRMAVFNVLVETTKELFRCKTSLQYAHGLIETCVKDEKIEKEGN